LLLLALDAAPLAGLEGDEPPPPGDGEVGPGTVASGVLAIGKLESGEAEPWPIPL